MATEQEVNDNNLPFRLTRFDSQIKLEFDLISHRMSWLIEADQKK